MRYVSFFVEFYLIFVKNNKVMIEKQICAKILFCTFDELPDDEKKLVEYAKDAASKAYAPYSNFKVGAALYLKNGETVTGSNQENAAYPSGLCAERVAMFYANAKNPDEPVVKMAVVAMNNTGFTDKPITPCGSCRQALLECQNRYGENIKLLMYSADEIAIVESVTDLLPLSFGKDYL